MGRIKKKKTKKKTSTHSNSIKKNTDSIKERMEKSTWEFMGRKQVTFGGNKTPLFKCGNCQAVKYFEDARGGGGFRKCESCDQTLYMPGIPQEEPEVATVRPAGTMTKYAKGILEDYWREESLVAFLYLCPECGATKQYNLGSRDVERNPISEWNKDVRNECSECGYEFIMDLQHAATAWLTNLHSKRGTSPMEEVDPEDYYEF